jgi:hypothetical protein
MDHANQVKSEWEFMDNVFLMQLAIFLLETSRLHLRRLMKESYKKIRVNVLPDIHSELLSMLSKMLLHSIAFKLLPLMLQLTNMTTVL